MGYDKVKQIVNGMKKKEGVNRQLDFSHIVLKFIVNFSTQRRSGW